MVDPTTTPAPRAESAASPADVSRLAAAIEMLSKSIDRLDREIATMRADARADMASLRSDARSDFRLMFGALIAATLGLAGLMAKGFHLF